LSALRTASLYPHEIFLVLIPESTPGPQCGRKDYVNEKFQMTPSGIETAVLKHEDEEISYYPVHKQTNEQQFSGMSRCSINAHMPCLDSVY